ncbi:MAG: hypothetical protein NTX33_04815 [Propionibacteriales bacterium]|nr:hypothetical protein [Propionibacteriales bacterium]
MSLNTTPATWTTSETVTATKMNTEIRDALTGIQAAWTSYSPAWTSSGTSPVIGNGSIVGRYLQVGKSIDFKVVITMGSTTTYGTGVYSLSLPAGLTPTTGRWGFYGTARDTSATQTYPLLAEWTGTALALKALPTTAGNPATAINATIPFTWANTDELFISGRYEAV